MYYAQFVVEVYDAVRKEVESLTEGDVGSNLAYLMGSMLKGERFQAFIGAHDDFMLLLLHGLGRDHAVWTFIDLMGEDDEPLPTDVKVGLLAGKFVHEGADWINVFRLPKTERTTF